MAVDAVIAGAWGKLIGKGVYESTDPLSPKSSPRTRWFIRGYMARYIPDPAMQPWEWVKRFEDFWLDRLLSQPSWIVRFRADYIFSGTGQGDTPEAALEAAIRTWVNHAGNAPPKQTQDTLKATP